jgi:hypothetical protein
MYRPLYTILAITLALGGLSATAPNASAFDCWTPTVCDCGYMKPICRARYNWNRNYSYTDFHFRRPPRAADGPVQTNYGWGVASSRISRIDHQFQRLPGRRQFGGPFRPTPGGQAIPRSLVCIQFRHFW